ncbi:HD domain-containing protein [Curvivirga aplysinae]|uniref:HD family hydrolase n=1 Tax=Curvivirga aplysinae TaxID=2529852 RepID=UPI0012BBAAE2|nr:HD family hydrolase [Curvivirga aplysinae]MTI11193.1 HD family hydrolase [Curvivirga aplysinae]
MGKTELEPRAWQRMLSGRRLDLLDPSPVDIEIEDIAHGLARVARWNGQTEGPYALSVAQHSIVVEEFVGRLKPDLPVKWRLASLLHDAPEYVVGDMISPFKSAIGINYRDLEHRLQKTIHIRFGLPPEIPDSIEKLIKRADRASAYFEAIQLAGFTTSEANKLWRKPKAIGEYKISLQSPEQAKEAFIIRFEQLLDQL